MLEQTSFQVDKSDILNNAGELKSRGYRLSQICATVKDGFDVLYTFEKKYKMVQLHVQLGYGEELESVSVLFSYAYLYENEMKDLFGIEVGHMNVDFKGHLYETAIKHPFHPGEAAVTKVTADMTVDTTMGEPANESTDTKTNMPADTSAEKEAK
jgi:ech hydrogenase subunit D